MNTINEVLGAKSAQQFRNAPRIQQSLLAGVEKRCLIWLARRVPAGVKPDHLTALGFVAMFMAGASYALARWWTPALILVNVWLALNWLGDSLDGTLARERQSQRPRYGFYVDHMIDSFGGFFLMGGLALSGYMTWPVAAGMLISFYLLSINSYLATYTLGTFHLSHWKFSPTEIRVLLTIGNVIAFRDPTARILGTEKLFFDVAGVVSILAMVTVLVNSVLRNTIALYRLERL